PGALLLPFAEAERDATRLTEHRLRDGPRDRTDHVPHHEPQGATDRGVRAAILPETGVATLDAERLAPRAVQHHRRSSAAGGGGVERVEVEAWLAAHLDCREDRREVLGAAACQDGIHGDLLDRGLAAAGLDDTDDVPRRERRRLEHGLDAGLGGRDDGKTVAP